MSAKAEYKQYIENVLDDTLEKQMGAMTKASHLVKEAIKNEGRFYVFGTGHSHMIAEEIYNRAGGLALVSAILEPSLMLHEQPNKSTYLERLDGYGEVLLKINNVSKQDVLMIISNSGRNPVPVEMALKAKEMGCNVIAMTSLTHSSQVSSRHTSGKRLFEIADVVLDNGSAFGDAAFTLEGLENPIGPTSTLVGVAMAHMLIIGTVEGLIQDGHEPPVFRSSNVDGADEYNNKLFERYVK
ncbi:SIS domain-containing protein [Lederbergia sp. NSJ-179]|uniref:SIS domain-containing protein n=1 Tax=Lederbergia sp. NSJ-179 TaxID=2931402 RepID=UPI001FD0F765|nr:SIS domain-containing protein [Lederbergia sp. NSJ-179]MCJ7843112.1 SIS domain-containing protein [Lederbergia sp. NSJ-179]